MKRQPEKRRKSRRRDSGTALTEFVIVMPLFILLLYWAEFLSDLGLVKMSLEEAARYTLWETAAMRQPSTVAIEVQARFKDLSSPSSIMGSTPIGVRSFKTVTIPTPLISTNGAMPFNGRLSLPTNTGGLLGSIINGLDGFINSTVDGLVADLKFNANSMAQVSLSYQVTNTLFPGMTMLFAPGGPQLLDSTSLSDGVSNNITMTMKSPSMLIDVWKAWPSPYASSSTNTNADVFTTYPSGCCSGGSASPAENEVSGRLKHLAFFGLLSGGVGDVLSGYLTVVGFPDAFSTKTWASNNGPVTMLPGEAPRNGAEPAARSNSQRLGDQSFPQSANLSLLGPAWENSQGSPNMANIDRARSTVPSYIHTGYWSSTGGTSNASVAAPAGINTTAKNPYLAEYNCRDVYYLGSMVANVLRYNNKNANKTAFPACQ